jgi:hypothetical protein
MLVYQLLDSSRNRIPWSTMRAIFKMCNLPMGRGWEDTIKKLTDENNVRDEFEDSFAQLKEYYCNHLLIGEKAIKLFEVNRRQIDRLIDSLVSHEIEKTVFHETYPFPLGDESLREIDSSTKLVDIRNSDCSLAVVFCTKRFFTERTEIDTTSFSEEAKKDLDGYDELVGIKRYTRQFFDAVVLWKDKELIEVRVDIANGIIHQEINRAFVQTIHQFNDLSRQSSGIESILKENGNVNFFPLISRLYESGEGKVGELAFTTDEGSSKFEKMRRGGVDLRNEIYHKAGSQAVDHITPYRLAILWKFLISEDLETHPELFLPGQARVLSNLNPILNEVFVRKCSGLEDYKFVFEKIITCLHARGQ